MSIRSKRLVERKSRPGKKALNSKPAIYHWARQEYAEIIKNAGFAKDKRPKDFR